MNYLVDTHIFLWIILSPKKISKEMQATLINPENTKHVSIVTFWEIAIKFSLGKIDMLGLLPDELPALAKETGFEVLTMDQDIVSSVFKLPKIKNKDPFDQMLAWQAISYDCILLTQDQDFSDYKDHGLKIVW